MKKINYAGFTLVEVLVVVGIGVIVSTVIASFMIVPININQTVNNKFKLYDLMGELGRGIRSSTNCKSMLAMVGNNFDQRALMPQVEQGLPIALDVATLGLTLKAQGQGGWMSTNSFRSGVRVDNYNLQIDELTLFGAESLGSDPNTGNRAYLGTVGMKVTSTEGIAQGSISRRIATVAFTLAPAPSSRINDCIVPNYENHLICGKESKVYVAPAFSRNGYTADSRGCINPLALRAPLVPSDLRLKKNIEKFPYGLKEVLQVQPYTYYYNGLGGLPSDQLQIGVIAQDVEKYAPKLVSKIQLKLKSEDSKLTSVRAVQYEGFTMMLARAIQEQQVQINQLQSEIRDIKYLKQHAENRTPKP